MVKVLVSSLLLACCLPLPPPAAAFFLPFTAITTLRAFGLRVKFESREIRSCASNSQLSTEELLLVHRRRAPGELGFPYPSSLALLLSLLSVALVG